MNDQARPQHLKAKPVMQQYITLTLASAVIE